MPLSRLEAALIAVTTVSGLACAWSVRRAWKRAALWGVTARMAVDNHRASEIELQMTRARLDDSKRELQATSDRLTQLQSATAAGQCFHSVPTFIWDHNGHWLTLHIRNSGRSAIVVKSCSIAFADGTFWDQAVLGGQFISFGDGGSAPKELPAVLLAGFCGSVRFATDHVSGADAGVVYEPPDWQRLAQRGLESVCVSTDSQRFELTNVPWPPG